MSVGGKIENPSLSQSQAQSPSRLLVVDDMATNRLLLASAFKGAGYDITEAGNGREALGLLEENEFDLVLLDVMMPDMDGFEVLEAIRRKFGFSELAVIMLTSVDESEGIVRALQNGANDYISKPFEAPVAIARVETQLSRMRAENTLRRSHELLEERVTQRTLELQQANEALALTQFAVDHAGDCMYWLDSEGRILYANRKMRSLWDLGADDGLEITATDIYADFTIEDWRTHWHDLTEANNLNFETKILLPGGKTIDVEVTANYIMFGGQEYCCASARDITGRNAAQATLVEAQKMEVVGQLTSGVAHDFNNILTVIAGNLQLLERQAANNADAIKRIHASKGATERAMTLTRQLVALSKRTEHEAETLNANDIIDDLGVMLRRVMGERVTVNFDLADDLWPVNTDRVQFESAILNIVVNARDAMPQGGELTIRTANVTLDGTNNKGRLGLGNGSYATLSVTDTGIGMTEDVRERAVEPFFTTKPAGTGTGLGLSITHDMVTKSGGEMDIRSTPNEGTTVTLFLPKTDIPVEQGAAPFSGDATVAGESAGAKPLDVSTLPRGSESILFVEADSGLRIIGTDLLKTLGYTVYQAENGPEALAFLQREHERLGKDGIDLLITDVEMPEGMTGADLARFTRIRMPNIKVLFASPSAEGAGDTLSGEADPAVIKKPYHLATLARLLRDLLSE